MKITPRPISVSDHIDQSRDIAGLNKWAQSSRTVGFIMFVLGWFTIPVEVLLRRDFGQRWFTTINFYAGFFLLLVFAVVQYVVSALWGGIQEFISRIATAINPFHTEPEAYFTDRIMNGSMAFFLFIYMLMGSYHLFKIWWRNRTNTALHSFDDGTSRMEPLAGYLMRVLNVLTVPFVYLYRRLLPRKQRLGIPAPKLINDRTAFANTVVEPVFLLMLSYQFQGIASIWLFISAIALAIHANWKETAKLNKVLDFRDSVIEANVMMHLKEETEQPTMSNLIMKQTAATIKTNPHAASQVTEQYPDLMNIIDEMNRDKSHLAN
jgi:hypothetical protein